jgi:TRAP-type C4-dicarboxylate transport system permease small subunit
MQRIRKVNEALFLLEEWITVWLQAAMLFLVFTESMMRYLLGVVFTWQDELARLFCLGITYFCLGIAVRRKNHIRIDIIGRVFPSLERSLKLLGDIGTVIGCVILDIVTVQQIIKAHKLHQVEGILEMPLYIPYYVIAVGITLFLIRAIEEMILDWKSAGAKSKLIE